MIKRALALLLSLALLLWLLQGAHWQGVIGRLLDLDPLQLGVALAAFTLSYLLRGARVWDEFRHDAGGGYPRYLRLTVVHNAAVNVLPFRGGEAAFPLLLNRWFDVPVTRSVASLFWLRLQDAIVVMLLALAVWPGLPTALRLLGAVVIASAAIALPAWARRHPEALPEHGRFARLAHKLRAALAISTRRDVRSWLWTLSNWSVKLAAQAWLLASLLGRGLDVGAAGALGAELAAILPIQGVAGFGTYEAGAAALLRPHAVTLAEGLQAALALHLFVIACALGAGALAATLLPGAPTSKSNLDPL